MTNIHRPSDSAVEATHLVLPSDTNAHGTAFGGKVMQWMDIAAGIAGGRHSGKSVVTLAVDDLHFERPIHLGDVVIIRSMVNHAGSTSMEVGVRVDREEPTTRRQEHCLSGYFIFVAVDPHGRPVPVPTLTPSTPEEQRRFDNAVRRRERRMANRKP
jgi:acyl-CoA hydrolase